jgi:hypothetical protein
MMGRGGARGRVGKDERIPIKAAELVGNIPRCPTTDARPCVQNGDELVREFGGQDAGGHREGGKISNWNEESPLLSISNVSYHKPISINHTTCTTFLILLYIHTIK